MSRLDQLLLTPPAELVAELKTLRDARATIESKETVLEQLLEMLAQQGGKAAEEIASLGASVAIGPLRQQILRVLESKREENLFVMVPQAVHDELVERGNRTVKLDNVRITMKRMAQSNELEEPDSLLFGLPGASDLLSKFQALDGGQQR